MEAIKKATPTRESLYKTPDQNPTALQSVCKRMIILLALWGLISPKTATTIIKNLGLSHA